MKVGIITMHKVQNYGSVLQAYALQKKVKDLGFECEIIDYIYPNSYHRSYQHGKTTIKGYIKKLLSMFINIFDGTTKKKNKAFADFYNTYLRLSETYLTKESIKENPPVYDIYMTGSDQVWNPRFVKDDSTFMLSFVPKDSYCVSYASSFAASCIPNNLQSLYARELSKYSFLSVREATGTGVIRTLIDRESFVTCDPTLLLSKKEWEEVANHAKIQIEGDYILAYVLHYSFNPYPEIEQTIRHLQAEYNLPVIYLDGLRKYCFYKNTQVIRAAGPCDFVRLFKDASYVVTSSFHGTAFSLIFEKPLAVMVDDVRKDSRIQNLLNICGKEACIVTKQNPIMSVCKMQTDYSMAFDSFKEYSCKVLEEMIKNKVQ